MHHAKPLRKVSGFGNSEGIPQSDAPGRSIRIIAWDAIHGAIYFADNGTYDAMAQCVYVVSDERIEYYEQ
jgi:hypothetical protein